MRPTKGVLHNNGDRDRCYFLLIAVCDVRSMALVCDHVDLLLTELLMEQLLSAKRYRSFTTTTTSWRWKERRTGHHAGDVAAGVSMSRMDVCVYMRSGTATRDVNAVGRRPTSTLRTLNAS